MHVSNLAFERNDFQPNRAGSWLFHCNLEKMAACASCMLAKGAERAGAHKAIYLELQWEYSTTYLEEPAHPRTGVHVGELFPLPKSVEGLPE